MNTIRIYTKEELREIEVDHSLKLGYAISNKARMIRFKDDMKTGRLLKGREIDGYKIFGFKIYREDKKVNKRFFLFLNSSLNISSQKLPKTKPMFCIWTITETTMM